MKRNVLAVLMTLVLVFTSVSPSFAASVKKPKITAGGAVVTVRILEKSFTPRI